MIQAAKGWLRGKALTPAADEAPKTDSYLLRYTSTCGEVEFRERCQQHDFWYHTFRFDNGFVQHGDYDIGRDIDDYGFPVDMTGMSVLDVGTGSGWFATYFEQRGANVTTVDARGYADFDVFGRLAYPDIKSEKPSADLVLADGREIYYGPHSRGFWIMKELLGLRAEYLNSRIYDIQPDVFGGRKFDLVFAGAILMHLRDPIGALMALRSVCSSQLITNSLRWVDREADPTPQMMMVGHTADHLTWWTPNRACLEQWFYGAGFNRVDADRTVNATADKPFVDAQGRSTGVHQSLYLVHAFV